MISFPIQLTSVSDIKTFVDAASRLDCDVDVICGRYLVDGKSIMGLFSIDLSEPIQLEIHGALSQADKDRIIAEVASCPVCEILSGPIELGKLD